jgi:hypothetical protein
LQQPFVVDEKKKKSTKRREKKAKKIHLLDDLLNNRTREGAVPNWRSIILPNK